MLSRLVCARKKREKEQEQQQNMGIGHAMGVPTAHYYICSAWDGGGERARLYEAFSSPTSVRSLSAFDSSNRSL